MEHRLPGNLNISFAYVEGEAPDDGHQGRGGLVGLRLHLGQPRAVLRSARAGRRGGLAHTSIRFGLGRFTTEEEVDYVVDLVIEKVNKLRELSPLYEMAQEGIDLKTIQWAAH